MSKFKQQFKESPGQALVEFALIAIVLLMMIFLIIETARILWAWNTVQNAAREGARYAITGQAEKPDCAVQDLPKFNYVDRDTCTDLRLASIINKAHTHLAGLPLNEASTAFEDDNYYNIEVWGVDRGNQLHYDFGGAPTKPVVVRVTYRVPIITPFFRPIIPSIPVFGQETLTNETFGQLDTGNQGAGLPPQLPPLPTPGVTPSPTPSPTPQPEPTRGPTDTPEPTATFTAEPNCPIVFDQFVVADGDNQPNDAVIITADVGTSVTIINLTTGATIGGGNVVNAADGHACPGLLVIVVNEDLQAGDLLMVVDDNDSDNFDITSVLALPPTNTPSPTNTPAPTSSPTNTPTITPTFTPSGPYITLLPNCGVPDEFTGEVQVRIVGYNWPTNESYALLWDGVPQTTEQAGHSGVIDETWTFTNLADGSYEVRAETGSGGDVSIQFFDVPCDDQPTPTPVPSATATPRPPDLIIDPPVMVSTPPITAYLPVDFSVRITNIGDVDVASQFFVDIYLDPSTIMTDSIPISESSGYSAVSGLAGGASRVITITAPFGFENPPPSDRLVYGMVDSVEQIQESIETNNVSSSLTVPNVQPGTPPTPTPTPGGGIDEISGDVRAQTLCCFVLQRRAVVTLIDESTSAVVGTTTTDDNGSYTFTNVAPGTYTVSACISIDGVDYYGLRTGRTPPNPYVDIFAVAGACP